MGLKLIHDPKMPPSFNSGKWLCVYNPDNIIRQKNEIAEPLPCTQHKAIICAVEAVVKPETVQFKRRFNFKRAKWEQFSMDLDEEIINIDRTPEKYDLFVRTVQTISHRYIPRGLNCDSKALQEKYERLFQEDTFFDDTTQTCENLLHAVSSSRRAKWCNLVSNIYMKQNIRKVQQLLKNLDNQELMLRLAYLR
ncbi:hypothetical protein PR048_009020 [Dryococelus australis]|uniref:Uncharacterized protein n=1 Tax=Dryococelus australis TaxID=614101 RepID=A0ABQ9HZI5_9NEOP|nr:hypothetical protein PR048_009020 [Dryococelus australis]